MYLPTTSQRCLDQIDTWNREYAEDYPSDEDRETTWLLREVAKRVVDSREPLHKFQIHSQLE